MAALDTSVNLFALLDGNDPGDKRLADFDPQQKEKKKDKAGAAKKQPAASTVVPDYKLKLMKPPSTPAPSASSRAPWKTPAPAVAAGLRSAAATSMARTMNKQTTPTAPAEAPARSTNFTALLFGKAYPSARERIFKQRQEEYERRQAQAKAMNAAGVTGDDSKSAAAVAAPAGKTHGARVQHAGRAATVKEAPVQAAPPVGKGKGKVVDGGKQRQGVTVYEAAAPLKPLTPLPSLEDMDQFPSLK